MIADAPSRPPEHGQFLIYIAEDGVIKIDVRLEAETVWLTQQHMADLFQTSKQNIGQHLKNVFAEGELGEDSVVKNFFTTATDGKNYRTNFYSLDAIISVGYRVKSVTATRFRIWATQKLKEFIVKGFVLDDERLKNPHQPFDYFEELLRRIQDIRTSERRFYQKITDIYATSIDYDPTQYESIEFFKTVQNKLHWAITGQTAAEMRDWINKLNSFLALNDRDILDHAGKISHDMAKELAESEYAKFHRQSLQQRDAALVISTKCLKGYHHGLPADR